MRKGMKAVARHRLKTKHNVMVTGSRSKLSPDTPAELTIKANLIAAEDNEKASLKITESQGKDISNIRAKSSKNIRSQGEEDLLDSFKSSDHDDESSFASVEENRPYHQYSEGKTGQTSLANDRMFCDIFGADEACADNDFDLDAAIVDVFLDDNVSLDDKSLDGVFLDDVSLDDELLDGVFSDGELLDGVLSDGLLLDGLSNHVII